MRYDVTEVGLQQISADAVGMVDIEADDCLGFYFDSDNVIPYEDSSCPDGAGATLDLEAGDSDTGVGQVVQATADTACRHYSFNIIVLTGVTKHFPNPTFVLYNMHAVYIFTFFVQMINKVFIMYIKFAS